MLWISFENIKKKKKITKNYYTILKSSKIIINTLQRRQNGHVTNELGVGWGLGGRGGGGGSYLRMVDDDRDSFVFQTALLTDGDSVYRHKQLDSKQRDQNKRGLYCFPGNEQIFFKYHLYK